MLSFFSPEAVKRSVRPSSLSQKSTEIGPCLAISSSSSLLSQLEDTLKTGGSRVVYQYVSLSAAAYKKAGPAPASLGEGNERLVGIGAQDPIGLL